MRTFKKHLLYALIVSVFLTAIYSVKSAPLPEPKEKKSVKLTNEMLVGTYIEYWGTNKYSTIFNKDGSYSAQLIEDEFLNTLWKGSWALDKDNNIFMSETPDSDLLDINLQQWFRYVMTLDPVTLEGKVTMGPDFLDTSVKLRKIEVINPPAMGKDL